MWPGLRPFKGGPFPGSARTALPEPLHNPQGRLAYGLEPERQCEK